MQVFSVLGYAILKRDTLIIPELLGEQPEVVVRQFGGQSMVIYESAKEPMSSQEFLEATIEKISERLDSKVIFMDIIEKTNPENNTIFFDNTFKNLRYKTPDIDIKGSLGDIIKELFSSAGVDAYYIAEEEDGTILSITRKT